MRVVLGCHPMSIVLRTPCGDSRLKDNICVFVIVSGARYKLINNELAGGSHLDVYLQCPEVLFKVAQCLPTMSTVSSLGAVPTAASELQRCRHLS